MFRNIARIFFINLLVFISLLFFLEIGTRIIIFAKWGETAYLKYGIKYPAVNFSHVGPNYHHDFGDYLAFWPKTHRAVTWANGEDVYINEYGFRSKDFTIAKASDTYRIITMGESSTFGFHVADKKTWPFLMEKKYEKTIIKGKKVEVINLGLPWYNSTDNLNLLKFCLKLRPDLVIYYGGANDIVDIGIPKLRRLEQRSYLRAILDLEKYSLFLYKSRILIQTHLEKMIAQREGADTYSHLTEKFFSADQIQNSVDGFFVSPFLENLRRFKKILNENKTQFVIVTQIRAPLGRDWIDLAKEKRAFTEPLREIEKTILNKNFFSYSDYLSDKLYVEGKLNVIETVQFMHSRLFSRMIEFSKKEGIPLIDFVRIVNGNFSLLTTDLHLTEAGNEEMAKVLVENLAQLDLTISETQ
jgi:lysophospholipase L1-like esterase